MLRAITILLVVCSLVLGSVRLSTAQDSTPIGGIVPDPSECQVEPRPMDELMALWPEATPTSGTAVASPDTGTPFTGLPEGEPADLETTTAVTMTVREVFACFNAGNFRGALSLFSDDLVRTFGPEPGTSQADIEGFLAATPAPVAEGEQITLVGIVDAVVVEDGRVAVVVVSIDPSTGSSNQLTDLVYLVEQDGQWLVDEVIEGITLTESTPAA